MTGSKYFDSIRSSSAAKKAKEAKGPPCAWKGCAEHGTHKAPAGRGREGQYLMFCADHVREYNANYNYFLGMSDEQVAKFQADAITGHRPTWKTGMAGASLKNGDAPSAEQLKRARVNDPHAFFAYRAKRDATAPESRRYVKPLDRKALEKLHLAETASKEEIKARYKDLVKKHHPDVNGGDARSAEALREIIAAYNQLKSSGLV
ncbi:MAG: hypothetical protein RL291_1869 [Pseudomonadota bacterium]